MTEPAREEVLAHLRAEKSAYRKVYDVPSSLGRQGFFSSVMIQSLGPDCPPRRSLRVYLVRVSTEKKTIPYYSYGVFHGIGDDPIFRSRLSSSEVAEGIPSPCFN